MRLLSLCLLAIFTFLTASSVIYGGFELEKRSISQYTERDLEISILEKRKGGGSGGGGKGGSSGGSSGGKTGSSGSGSSGSRTSGSSNSGGTAPGGSGVRPSYGGGRYYGGGAAVPFAAGSRTPRGLGAVGLIPLAGLGFFGGAWLYGAYAYPYSHPYSYHNRTSNQNETKPVQCLCQEYSVCGCDDNDDPAYLSSVVGDGDPNTLNQSLVRVATVNDTSTIFLNGTLPNGTTADGPDQDSAASFRLHMPPMVNTIVIAGMVASLLYAL